MKIRSGFMPEKYASYMCKICLRINFAFDIGIRGYYYILLILWMKN